MGEVMSLALRLTAEVVTNMLVVAARVADWALEQIQSDTKRFLTLGGSEYYGSRADLYEDRLRECPCGERLNLYEAVDSDDTDWRHDDNSRACDDVARELFDIQWEYRDSIGLVGPAINMQAVDLLKNDPEEYFRLNLIWRDLPKD